MARFIVDAEATGGTGVSSAAAKPGNSDPAHIVVSVMRGSGAARTGLLAANFLVDPLMVGPGGSAVTITQVTEPRPGGYLASIVPMAGQTWKLGRYIFYVAVTSGADRGQTVCAVMID